MEQFIKDIWAVICSIVGVAMFVAFISVVAGFGFGLATQFIRLFI